MRKKTIKYTIVDLGGTRYVVLRLADLDTLITTHHSLSLELIPVLSEAQWNGTVSCFTSLSISMLNGSATARWLS